MEERPKDRKLRDALVTYIKEHLLILIMADMSAPESFRLRRLLDMLLTAVAPYSDPWVAMETVMMNLTGLTDELTKLALEQILVNCSEANVVESCRMIPTGEMKFVWTKSADEAWECNTLYGTARIHPREYSSDKYILAIDPSEKDKEPSTFKSKDLRELMTVFENRHLKWERLKNS